MKDGQCMCDWKKTPLLVFKYQRSLESLILLLITWRLRSRTFLLLLIELQFGLLIQLYSNSARPYKSVSQSITLHSRIRLMRGNVISNRFLWVIWGFSSTLRTVKNDKVTPTISERKANYGRKIRKRANHYTREQNVEEENRREQGPLHRGTPRNCGPPNSH